MSNLSVKYIKSQKNQSNIYHGQFIINFLRPGQGITVGNQLRRALLGDVGGVAISAIRFKNIKHEFESISGVREDILEILLNLKGIVLKSNTKKDQFGYLSVQGPKVITASLISLPSTLEVVNPNHYIATLSSNSILEIEFKFEYGFGYKLSDRNFLVKNEGFLQLDSVFMPVQKVDFKVEVLHDSKNNVYEKLLLEIWTNGSLLPDEAFNLACKQTVDLFNTLIKNKNISLDEFIMLANEPYLNILVEELNLSVRAYNSLKKANINTLGDLLKYSSKELKKIKNLGIKSANEIFLALKQKIGLALKDK